MAGNGLAPGTRRLGRVLRDVMSNTTRTVTVTTTRACAFVMGAFLFPLRAASAQDSTLAKPNYESARLEALVGEAARINALIPERLRAYRARIETEMSIAIIDSAGRERTAQLEQIASDVRWRAEDRYDQRVIGYRSQAIGPMFSMMSIFGGWTTPTLYGNRLQLGVTPTPAVA